MSFGLHRGGVWLLLGVWLVGCGDTAKPVTVPQEEARPGGKTTIPVLSRANAFSFPVDNITLEHERLFQTGNRVFNQSWVTAPSSTEGFDGVGPLFNARSCSACHFRDGRGAPPLVDGDPFLGLLLRLSIDAATPVTPDGVDAGAPAEDAASLSDAAPRSDAATPVESEARAAGEPIADPNYGGQLQPFSILGVAAEGAPRVVYQKRNGKYADGEAYELLVPEYTIEELAYGPLAANIQVSPRVAPAMIGLGLLEAIPERRLLELADENDDDGDGISGRPNRVWDIEQNKITLGRFGWKAEQPSVRQQSAGALLGDIGITSQLHPTAECTTIETDCSAAPSGGDPEIDPGDLDRVALYGSLLGVPLREDWNSKEVVAGRALFSEIGCAACHVPGHMTGKHELEELSNTQIWPYTDLLLHDMGADLSDDRPVFTAEGREWRTPPLWGNRFVETVNSHDRMLHDGRARGVAEAILWHGGEAKPAQKRFVGLSKDERAKLVQFVESL